MFGTRDSMSIIHYIKEVAGILVYVQSVQEHKAIMARLEVAMDAFEAKLPKPKRGEINVKLK